MKQLFVVSVVRGTIKRITQEKTSANGAKYWRYEYELLIWLGGTELKAQVIWKENVSSHSMSYPIACLRFVFWQCLGSRETVCLNRSFQSLVESLICLH